MKSQTEKIRFSKQVKDMCYYILEQDYSNCYNIIINYFIVFKIYLYETTMKLSSIAKTEIMRELIKYAHIFGVV